MSDAKKLSSMDASFLYLETPEMPMHVGSMAIFRLPADYKGDFFEDFKAMIASPAAAAGQLSVVPWTTAPEVLLPVPPELPSPPNPLLLLEDELSATSTPRKPGSPM